MKTDEQKNIDFIGCEMTYFFLFFMFLFLFLLSCIIINCFID